MLNVDGNLEVQKLSHGDGKARLWRPRCYLSSLGMKCHLGVLHLAKAQCSVEAVELPTKGEKPERSFLGSFSFLWGSGGDCPWGFWSYRMVCRGMRCGDSGKAWPVAF